VHDHRLISSVRLQKQDDIIDRSEIIFDLTSTQRRIASLQTESYHMNRDFLERNESIDPGITDVPTLQTFQSKDRHSDVTPQQLCERWGISLKAATATLRKTTQRFLRSAILPLSRRYRTDMMFERKTLRGQWSTDTMDGRCKSLDQFRTFQKFK